MLYLHCRSSQLTATTTFRHLSSIYAAQLQHLTHLQLDLGSSSFQLIPMEKPGGIQSFIGAVRSLPRLCTCQSMRRLELSRLQTTADFEALKALRQLQRLKLDTCALPDSNWCGADSWPLLEECELMFCGISDDNLGALAGELHSRLNVMIKHLLVHFSMTKFILQNMNLTKHPILT